MYVKTSGTAANGARTFSFSGVIEDQTGPTALPFAVINIVTNSKASGGEDIETIEKIKYMAPKFFASQNRAVTSSDYEVIARNVYPAVSDVIVFGGENQSPPGGWEKSLLQSNHRMRLSCPISRETDWRLNLRSIL